MANPKRKPGPVRRYLTGVTAATKALAQNPSKAAAKDVVRALGGYWGGV